MQEAESGLHPVLKRALLTAGMSPTVGGEGADAVLDRVSNVWMLDIVLVVGRAPP
ncbi:MAG: hypothetical protein ACLQUY_05075 [Ktedonobacterales bacterium]